MDFLASISGHQASVAILAGVVMCVAGLILMFTISQKTHALFVIFLGAVFSGLPFIASAKFGKEGLEIIINTNQFNKAVVENIEKNNKAVEELREGLKAVQSLVNGLQPSWNTTLPSPIPRLSPEVLKSIQNQLDTSITNTDDFILQNRQQQSTLNDILERNNTLIESLSR